MINISKKANQVLNIIKARYNFKNKSQAIEKLALESVKSILEPKLRPDFINQSPRDNNLYSLAEDIEREKPFRNL